MPPKLTSIKLAGPHDLRPYAANFKEEEFERRDHLFPARTTSQSEMDAGPAGQR
jgi:hypothetical protein